MTYTAEQKDQNWSNSTYIFYNPLEGKFIVTSKLVVFCNKQPHDQFYDLCKYGHRILFSSHGSLGFTTEHSHWKPNRMRAVDELLLDADGGSAFWAYV